MSDTAIQKIVKKSPDPKLIEDAFEFAKDAYKEKSRASGENAIIHATRVASMLADMNLDPTTISFGILHDILDDLPDSTKRIEIKEIEKKLEEILGE